MTGYIYVLKNTKFDSLGHCGRGRTKSVKGVKRGSKCDCWKLFCSTGIYYGNLLVTTILWMKYGMIWIIMWIGMLFLFNFQLRYLQTLSSIAAEHNSTIIFPMPMNILDHFMGKKSKDQELDALEDTFWALKSIQTHNNDIYMK